MHIHKHSFFTHYGVLIARILMGGMFLLAGVSKFTGIDGTAGYIASVGFPAPLALAWAAAIFEVVLGAALIGGFFFRQSALLLALFTLFISFPFHGPASWANDSSQQIMFMKNMAIVGGLLMMVAHGTGRSWALGSDGEGQGDVQS